MTPFSLVQPNLRLELAHCWPSLGVVTDGVRLVGTVLALAIVMLWTASLVRAVLYRHAEALAARAARLPGGLAALAALLHPPREGDADRAGYIPLAVGTLIFQARWFMTVLTELGRAQLALAGQVAILGALAFAIYHHGRRYRELTPLRAAVSLALMLVAGVGAAAVMR